uniref:Bicarbonate transporter-like transmembrane domain-containing protein n=1 Tax=Chenopodium quinoa TaxID=63459 RepID=A0A803L3N5_CHEQI
MFLHKAQALAWEFSPAKTNLLLSLSPSSPTIRWEPLPPPPPPGFLKLNVDTSFMESTKPTGIAGILRNEQGFGYMDMTKVPIFYILAASIPAIMIAGLYFFDHSVASQMAQQDEFNLRKPSSFHYDLFLLGFMTLICRLLGLPPCNGVLPQAPMHTKSLAVLKRQEAVVAKELKGLKEVVMTQGGYVKKFDPAKHIDAPLPIRLEQFLSSNRYLHQSCGDTSVGAVGAFMSLVSLPGNQFWERLPLLLVARKRRYKVLEDNHGSYLESVPFKEYMLPKLFPSEYLQELDAAEYEEVIGAPWMPVNSGERLNVFIKDCLAEYQEIICSPEHMPTVVSFYFPTLYCYTREVPRNTCDELQSVDYRNGFYLLRTVYL